MRNMSFQLTASQILDRTKTVTRRLGWNNLKPGDLVRACEKCQGLKRGEKVKRLATIRVISVRREYLCNVLTYSRDEIAREGFPAMQPADFLAMFLREMGCGLSQPVNRIEFEYV
jgi:hypothetical protein